MKDLNWESLGFSVTRTNAVIVSRYADGKWSEIKEDSSFALGDNPLMCALHYAVSCFEGLKAFRRKDGSVAMFRPLDNSARLRRSAEYLGIPAPSDEMFVEMCERCVRANIEFLPPYGGTASMYIRPILYGSEPRLGLAPAEEVTFAVMCCPVSTYNGIALHPCSAVVPLDYDRAAPHGSGSYKVSGNYACTFHPYNLTHAQGYGEMLFLNSATHEFVDEFGSSNFFAIKGDCYVTPLSDSVLPSITNKSLRTLAEDLGYKVEMRRIPVAELAEFDEVGACGTAVVITAISGIDIKEHLAQEPVKASYRYWEKTAGPVSTKLYNTLTGIQKGEIEDVHGWCHKIENV